MDTLIIFIVVMVLQVYLYVKSDQLAHFKCFILCVSYPNKSIKNQKLLGKMSEDTLRSNAKPGGNSVHCKAIINNEIMIIGYLFT